MKTNKAGRDLIQKNESCRLHAYPDVKGIPTIGWGATGPDVYFSLTWTQEQCDARFEKDLAIFEEGVSKLVKTSLTGNQFAALISLAYNIGLTAFSRSSCLVHLNKGDFDKAALAILRWDKVTVGGQLIVNTGLVRRRKEEKALFLTPDSV